MKLIALILGLICSFGQPPFNYIIPCACSIALFIHLLSLQKTAKASFWFSFCFGYGYFVYSHSWFSESLLSFGDKLLWLYPFGVLLIPAFFAFYFAALGWLIFKYAKGNAFVIAMIWLAMELLRSYGYIELPWLLIGYIWTDPISQSVSLFGIYGLSLLTIIWALSIRELFIRKNLSLIYFAFISFVVCYLYGIYHLKAEILQQNINVRIIQPNIDHNVESRIKNNYNNLLKAIEMSQSDRAIDYIIWPEGASDFPLNDDLLSFLKGKIPANSQLIFNSIRFKQEPLTLWNSLAVINSQGQIIDYYDKIHLVPLGEFIPFRSILPFINKITLGAIDYSPGKKLKPIATAYPFLPSLCYEASFPDSSEQFFTWIVNLTNDGWFGSSIGPKQHLAIAKFRSIEQGVPTARAALTGVSALIDSFGHIFKQIPAFKEGIIESKIPGFIKGFTIYHNYGNYALCALILILALILGSTNLDFQPQLTYYEKK